MKNFIAYYYNLFVNEYKKVNNHFYFKINDKSYEFTPFYGNIDLLYKIYSTVKNSNQYCHEIIINKDNKMITFYNNNPYILIKKHICIDKYVDIDEILSYDIFIHGKYKLGWKQLWKEKIDYYEYQMSQLSFKYSILKSSFDYYVGLTETAINLLNYINEYEINYFISHRRINNKEKLCDFFNPIEIIIDSKVRDIAEYVKINYINNNINLQEIYKILDYVNFNYTESILFFSRLLYPSYYFDLYDQIIQERVNEEKINLYINNNTIYEVFLKKIYIYLKSKYSIPKIEWLNN